MAELLAVFDFGEASMDFSKVTQSLYGIQRRMLSSGSGFPNEFRNRIDWTTLRTECRAGEIR